MKMSGDYPYRPSRIFLENGCFFDGYSPTWQKGEYSGEVVFTTGMTGYPESLTDPSYHGQILTFTFPLIGNFGVPSPEHWESAKIHAAGVIVSQVCHEWSHHTGIHSFVQWLQSQNVPLIVGVDTRALTKVLRANGSMLGVISPHSEIKISNGPPNITPLVSQVSVKDPVVYHNGEKTVIVVDCGIKENILRSLMTLPVRIKRVPYQYDYSDEPFDAVLVSNGPGDPIACQETVAILQKAMKKNKPLFGICLGSQLMALAAGAKTYKLPFGHRGHNQPCKDLETGRCYLTSQNHGYAVDEASLPSDWQVTFRNLNDQSVEGIAHRSKPFFSVQFHPEAMPGPTDTRWLFEKFYQLIQKCD